MNCLNQTAIVDASRCIVATRFIVLDGTVRLCPSSSTKGSSKEKETCVAQTREIRVGVQVKPQHGTYAAIRRAWEEADDLGVDTIFNWDHFFPLSGEPDGLHYECWTSL